MMDIIFTFSFFLSEKILPFIALICETRILSNNPRRHSTVLCTESPYFREKRKFKGTRKNWSDNMMITKSPRREVDP